MATDRNGATLTQLTGLALGGVGGFNAHDAGVLKAMFDIGIEPDVITCTSGAIFWVYKYLTDPDGIPAEVDRQADQVSGANALSAAVTGVPGVFAPAYQEYVQRWFTPWAKLSAREFFNRLLPAQVFESKISQAHFTTMADALNSSDIPIVFNAFAIAAGKELLFGNQAALDFLGVSTAARHRVLGRDEVSEYRPIDGGAVEAALWLVLYGLDHTYQGEVVVDGAYHRQLIVSELDRCDVIYAVKPQSDGWNSAPPANYFEVQDFNTEMWFNSSFAAEVAALQRSPSPPRIQPITMYRPLGYFNYFVEKNETYSEAYRKAKKIFTADRSAFRPLVHRNNRTASAR